MPSTAQSLVETGESMKQIADIKYNLDDNMKMNVIEPLHQLSTKDIKEVQVTLVLLMIIILIVLMMIIMMIMKCSEIENCLSIGLCMAFIFKDLWNYLLLTMDYLWNLIIDVLLCISKTGSSNFCCKYK